MKLRSFLTSSFTTFGALLLSVALSLATFAQTATGRIVGAVQDSSGAIVPGVTVTATNEATQVSFKTTSSSAGSYNTPYFSLPSVTVTTPATLGRSLGTSTTARIIQLAAKINF